MSIAAGLAIIGVCLALQAFFAGLEIALLSCDRVEIRHLAERQSHRARWVERFLMRPVDYLATTMIGVNVAVVVSASVTTHLASFFFPEKTAALVATACLWPLILLFGEFIPMSLALSYSLKASLRGVLALKVFYFLFYPFVRAVAFFSNLVNRKLGGRPDLARPYFTRDELRLVFRGADERHFDKAQERMVRGVFEFHKVRLSQIMIPLKAVVACPASATAGRLKRAVFDSAFSRIPIYRGSPSAMVGSVHAMDLVGMEDDVPIEKVMRPALKVSAQDRAMDVLRLLKERGHFMAVVEDASGRALGIVTMEDILEEIVGEIEDEYDEAVAV